MLDNEEPLFALLCIAKLTPSRKAARRMVEQGAVFVAADGYKDPLVRVTDAAVVVDLSRGPVIKCGRRFVRFGKEQNCAC